MECDFTQIWAAELQAYATHPTVLMVLIMMNGTKVMDLVDSEYSPKIIRKSPLLDPTELLDMVHI